jgi:hypothetical protein
MPARENPKTNAPENEKHADRAFHPFVEPLLRLMRCRSTPQQATFRRCGLKSSVSNAARGRQEIISFFTVWHARPLWNEIRT